MDLPVIKTEGFVKDVAVGTAVALLAKATLSAALKAYSHLKTVR